MYYVDKFLGELVKDKDDFAPPERYYEYRKGLDGMIIETYIVSYNPLKLINFAYSLHEASRTRLLAMHRYNFFEENQVPKNPTLYAFTVPPTWYEQEVAKLSE